jgi:large subunit ribosomal protein L17
MHTNSKKPKMQGKKPSHRRAVMRSQLLELIRAEKLQTTPSKAKILKQQFDKLITHAKKDTQAGKRNVEAVLRNDKASTKLFAKLLPRLQEVNSGYTLSARTLPRKGDNAEQMIVMVRGADLTAKRSKLQKALVKRDAKADEKQSKGVRGRLRGALSNVAPGAGDGKKKENVADTRRVST